MGAGIAPGLCLAVLLVSCAARETTAPPAALELRITDARTDARAGEILVFDAVFRNPGPEPLTVYRPQDGSTDGRVSPSTALNPLLGGRVESSPLEPTPPPHVNPGPGEPPFALVPIVKSSRGDNGPDLPKGVGFLMLAEPSHSAPFALYRLHVPPTVCVPSAHSVSDELRSLLWSAEGYPPALALARVAVDHQDLTSTSPEGFLSEYTDALRLLLGRQHSDPYFLAQAQKDEPGYMTRGSWYWLVSQTKAGQLLGWVSSDYFVYRNPATDFHVRKDLVERLPVPDSGAGRSGELVYVRLLNEGTDVWTPVLGRRIEPWTFRLLPPPEGDRTEEEWQFPPGAVAICEQRTLSGHPCLVAARRVD